jgi:excisionase family DNA binding protein
VPNFGKPQQPIDTGATPPGRRRVELDFGSEKAKVKLLLTKKEAASFFSVSNRTIDRWLKDGVLPSDAKCMIGGVVRFSLPVLLKHVDGADVDAATEKGEPE